MSASLVGSEMCIRDRPKRARPRRPAPLSCPAVQRCTWDLWHRQPPARPCLLYTSDAADDM
eukprot:6156014-Alexandrium_andersonii.AAC.1